MRDYSAVVPTFWTGKTGKQIRALGAECQVVALYLLTSPHSNMIGLYYLPKIYLAHETGISMEGACKALQSLSEVHFCTYNDDAETVFVHEMARYQIGTELVATDKRVKGVENELKKFHNNPLLKAFLRRYADAYHLDFDHEEASPLEAPSEPLRSQDRTGQVKTGQEQEGAPSTTTSGNISFVLQMQGGKQYVVPQEIITAAREAYPLVNIEREIKRAAAWLASNPAKRKKDAPRFLNNWFKGAQGDAEKNKATSGPVETTGRELTAEDMRPAKWLREAKS
jgi:hypothetical protein